MNERNDEQLREKDATDPAKGLADSASPQRHAPPPDPDDEGRGQPDPPVRGTTRPYQGIHDAGSEEVRMLEAQESEPGNGNPR
jgi:hypothetical protein